MAAEAQQVRLGVGIGVVDAVAHAGLSAQVHHVVELLGGKQPLHPLPVGQVELHEAVVGVRVALGGAPLHNVRPVDAQLGQSGILQSRVVVVVEVVHPHHLMSLLQQSARQAEADESGTAGYEYLHMQMSYCQILILHFLLLSADP